MRVSGLIKNKNLKFSRMIKSDGKSKNSSIFGRGFYSVDIRCWPDKDLSGGLLGPYPAARLMIMTSQKLSKGCTVRSVTTVV